MQRSQRCLKTIIAAASRAEIAAVSFRALRVYFSNLLLDLEIAFSSTEGDITGSIYFNAIPGILAKKRAGTVFGGCFRSDY